MPHGFIEDWKTFGPPDGGIGAMWEMTEPPAQTSCASGMVGGTIP
ncbi:MAG TPA: hypothetical protein VGN34_03160 [Ktedonobacteraceae bacterium]